MNENKVLAWSFVNKFFPISKVWKHYEYQSWSTEPWMTLTLLSKEAPVSPQTGFQVHSEPFSQSVCVVL